MKIRRRRALGQPRLEMASMIDIVFLLLVFFVMTFQVAAMEGDLAITAPAAGVGTGDDCELPPLIVYLSAEEDGTLAGVRMTGRRLASIDELGEFVQQTVKEHQAGGGSRTDFSVQLVCDEQLKYQHTIEAITSIRGRTNDDDSVTRLIEKIRFAPSR